ncbi:s1 motif domain-containing protein [Caerostris darwini]|uniref:S1 motif domain-containing protein n=1 Tax=Caerostris darwini TaxID=1538125 RepID=A0AAV4T6S2_9ARAC|nr:s1 motif domain-containing protein [Caerostris darwini]
MNENSFSCIKQVVKTIQLPLPFAFISNEVASITEILDSWKRRYVKQLKGVIVNYKNISLCSPGSVGFTSPYIHYKVTATFDLFCPNVGDIVKGKINYISREHIGCLIEGTINVTIYLSQDSSPELSQFIYLNNDILFEIVNFDYERNIIHVRGDITPKCILLMKHFLHPESYSNNHVKYSLEDGVDSDVSDDGIGSSIDTCISNAEKDVNFKKPLSSKKKSKTKSHKKQDNECDSLIESFSQADHIQVFQSIKQERSPVKTSSDKKKNSSTLFESNNKSTEISVANLLLDSSASTNSTEVVGTDSIDFTKIKKSKSPKRKRESEPLFMDTSVMSMVDEMPKKKKRKKSDVSDEKKVELKNEPSTHLSLDTLENNLLNQAIKIDHHGDVPATTKKKSSTEKDKETKKRKKKKQGSSDKKSKDKNKSKKKGKVLASGSVRKKDKKNKSKDKHAKKHKKSKGHKKDKNEKKKGKKKSGSKTNTVIKSEGS